jgi:predicted alpha/beta hydrolase family esterase
MHKFITLPGIGGSCAEHWQTLWESRDARFERFQPSNWDVSDLDDWIAALDRAVSSAREPVVLLAHSLACLLVAHWAQRSKRSVAGAFLVSVPDPNSAKFPAVASAFRAAPSTGLRFPALMVASTDELYGTIEYTRLRASQWQSNLVEVGALGHINAESGLGDWPQGHILLTAFRAGMGWRA